MHDLPASFSLGEMDEWYDILPHVSHRRVVWFSQCSQLFHAISESHLQHVQWKKLGLKGCSANRDVEGVRYLVERCGANVHAGEEEALRYAIENGHLEMVKYLGLQGADVHADDDAALRWASFGGNLEMVKYLVLECGANVHAMNEAALQLASYNGQLEVVKYLVLECGADVHAEDERALRF